MRRCAPRSQLRARRSRRVGSSITPELTSARDYVAISDVRSRREVLEVARRGRLSHDDLRAQIALVRQQQREVGKRIIQARRVLVREVIDVFGVQEVQRRHGMVWEIAGMEFPAPERFRREFMAIWGAQCSLHISGHQCRTRSHHSSTEPHHRLSIYHASIRAGLPSTFYRRTSTPACRTTTSGGEYTVHNDHKMARQLPFLDVEHCLRCWKVEEGHCGRAAAR